MNVKLLRKIAKVIQEKPREFDMRSFTGIKDCGTTHCIGGWAEALTGKEAHDALGITHQQGARLFYVEHYQSGGWPVRFRGRKKKDVPAFHWSWLPTPRQAAARIEHFIATDGAE